MPGAGLHPSVTHEATLEWDSGTRHSIINMLLHDGLDPWRSVAPDQNHLRGPGGSMALLQQLLLQQLSRSIALKTSGCTEQACWHMGVANLASQPYDQSQALHPGGQT